jgi:hypothetical protein
MAISADEPRIPEEGFGRRPFSPKDAYRRTAMKNGLFGAALAAVVWIALISPHAHAQEDGKDWPMYNRDLIGTRHNPGETAIDKSNAGRLEEKWRFPAKSSDLEVGVIHATPIVVDGYVYFGTATDPAFYKLAADGTLRWSYRNPAYEKKQARNLARLAQESFNARFLAVTNGVLSSALVTQDTVFFDDTGGWIYALDRASGAEHWKVNTRSKEFPGRYKDQSIGDTPKIYTIPVSGTPTKVVGVGCKNGGFYVLRVDDGRLVDHTPIYTGPPAYPLSPTPDPRMLALPSAMGGAANRVRNRRQTDLYQRHRYPPFWIDRGPGCCRHAANGWAGGSVKPGHTNGETAPRAAQGSFDRRAKTQADI